MKYGFIILLFCLSIKSNGQSISFLDLTNLTNLSDGEAHNYLTLGNAFKHQYLEEVGNKKTERFCSKSDKDKEQNITIGYNSRLSNGTVLRTVIYDTKDPQHIVNLVAQAKRARMEMSFQGQDANYSIYRFDNELYRVTMLISTTESKGSVEIKQKEYVGL